MHIIIRLMKILYLVLLYAMYYIPFEYDSHRTKYVRPIIGQCSGHIVASSFDLSAYADSFQYVMSSIFILHHGKYRVSL